MTATTQATKKKAPKSTKCIAVSTPFGFMYLESKINGGIYLVSEESEDIYRKYLLLTGCSILDFSGYDEQFIKAEDGFSEKFAGLLPITSNYGNTFP